LPKSILRRELCDALGLRTMINPEVLAYCAKEVEFGDEPLDLGMTPIDIDEVYRLMAITVSEIENDELVLKASLVKLLVENFVLNYRLIT
jgi:hypothetical protein